MKLVIVTGLSGAGKSIALDTLEDLGFYCVDNLPIPLLPALAEEFCKNAKCLHNKIQKAVVPREQQWICLVDGVQLRLTLCVRNKS